MLQDLGLGTSTVTLCNRSRFSCAAARRDIIMNIIVIHRSIIIICLFQEPPNLKLQHHPLLPVPDPSTLQVHYKHATHITIPQPDPLATLG